MKKKSVLVYGDYSGYGMSLVKGFRGLGYDADVLSFSGDGFKKIEKGISLNEKNKLAKSLSLLKLIPKILKYKNILIMNPEFFNLKLLGPLMIFLFKITNKNIILLCCGDDVEFIKSGKEGKLPNWPYMNTSLPGKNYYSRRVDIIINYIVASSVRKIIPTMYDYRKAWLSSKFSDKLTDTIPLACDGKVKTIKNKNYFTEKIIIMHGINREEFKGSKIIKQALIEIKNKYKDKVNIILPEKLPLEEYLKLMEEVDIAIDQTKSNSYGMNAIYSMLSGHIVLAPANKFFKDDLKIDNCPVISIQNNKESIFIALENLILHPENINKIKNDTQRYAIEQHECITVAKKIDEYLN